jgi:hypothetical protein
MNYSEPTDKPSAFREAAGLLEDHLSLAAVEAEYELALWRRRAIWIGLGVVACLAALVWLEVTAFWGLAAIGLAPVACSGILFGFHALVAAIAIIVAKRRDESAGQPFEGSKEQWRRTRVWIQELFS